LAGVFAQERSQIREAAIGDCAGMNAECPQAAPLFLRPPKLLRDPDHAVAFDRPPRQAVGEMRDSLLAEGAQRVAVEVVARRNPQPRFQGFASQNRNAFADPAVLRLVGHTGEFSAPA